MKRGQKEFWIIWTALMISELHGLNMEERYSACHTTCGCRYHDQELFVKCRGNKLREIPKGIPENVTDLDLSDNYIVDIEAGAFDNFTHLRFLNLEANGIRTLPEGVFDNLTRLEKLILKNNSLEELPLFRESHRSLIALYLSANKIRDILPTHVTRIPNLQHLYLDHNAIKEVPSALTHLTKLELLNLNFNNISVIQKGALRSLENLQELKLCCNGIVRIEEGAFPDLLIDLTLLRNNISDVPTEALKSLHHLVKLELGGNPIKCIHDNAFDGLQNLHEINLSWKNIEKVKHNAFINLPKITRLRLINVKLTRFPNLTGTSSLEILALESNDITSLPEDFCKMFPHLYDFNANMNRITRIPDMSGCSSMTMLKMDYNRITTIGTSLQGMTNIQDITLNGNNIKEIPANAFKGVSRLKTLALESNAITSLPEDFCKMFPHLYDFNANMNRIIRIPDMSGCSSMTMLKMDYNRITTIGTSLQGMKNIKDITLNGNNIMEIPANAFKGDSQLETLKLAKNNIISIADTAFVPLERLVTLDLSHNSFSRLPEQGLQSVLFLYLQDNYKLKEISSESLPNVRVVKASYPYHCCKFRNKFYTTSAVESDWDWSLDHLRVDLPENSSYPDTDDVGSGFGSGSLAINDSEWSESDIFENNTSTDHGNEVLKQTHKPQYHEVNCTPLPDPFFPCDDLMGSWLLRVGVWFVFLLALLGNAVVIGIILLSTTKVDVSRFLIINLAMADLCMGVYLGLLAFVDSSTIGNFMHHGVDWQQSSGCKAAGFLAVLSSEASVFTLAVITIERFIAIRHALHVHRKMTLRKTAVVMTFGWIMATVIATLPLYEVSDYTKFSVCLPFETGDVKSLVFVILILSLNFIAFVIIFACYVGIYHEIRGSSAWNTNDTQVAMRMALLVVTDFACWAPIVIIAFPAALGMSFVSLEQAKVFTIFVFPLNSCANPFLYAILTYQFKKDCVNICRKVKNSPVPHIQITLAKKRFSSSGGALEQRRGSQGSVIYYPETNSDGRLSLRVPGIRLNRRYSLPAALKLSSLQKEKKNSRRSSINNNSQCSNENTTEQTTLMQEKPRPLIDRRTAV